MLSSELSSFCGMIGRSAAIQALYRRIERVAPTDATVLILGERGTGKELVAHAIQTASWRRERPFVIVNCGAVPAELLASELFGHERGAFTGAWQRHRGLLAVADGGTLFLDEVADLPLTAQAMLLRFLQHGEVRPLGSATTAHVDVRLIAATNKDLPMVIERGAFRADLYDRLEEVRLTVPPLRERQDDIALLVHQFVRRHAARHRVRCRGMTVEALAVLEGYAWPGNVRELEQTLSRAVIFAAGEYIRPEHLELRESHDVGAVPGGTNSAQLTSRQRDVLRIVAGRGVVCRRDLISRFGISREAAHDDLAALVHAGLLRRSGVGRGTRYAPA